MYFKTLLTKTLLVAAGLCVGASSAWADKTYLSTMTGIVGPTDLSGAFWTYCSKAITIGDGETYVISFVNHNTPTADYSHANWYFEMTDGAEFFDAQVDGGAAPWGGASFSGKAQTGVYTDKFASATEWNAAYNGAEVTLTVTRSGNLITASHTATCTDVSSTAFSGTMSTTYTGSNDVNFYIVASGGAYQVITDVVKTSGDYGTIYTRSVHTAGAQWGSGWSGNYESTVDAAAEFYNTTTTNYRGAAYAKFAYTIPASATVLSATLTYNTNQGGSNSSRSDKISYMAKDFDIDWANFAGQKNVDLSYSSYRNDAVTVATGGTGVRQNLTGDVTAAVRTIYAENQNYIIFQWSENLGSANLYGNGATDYNAPQLEINYTTATTYNYTVNAKDGSSNILQEFASGLYIDGNPAISMAYPQFVLSGTNLYEIAANGSNPWYGTTFTPDAADYEKVLVYNKQTIANVVFYAEAENISGFTSNNANDNITNRSSGGKVARSGAYKALTTLGMGKYKIYARAFSDGNAGRNMTVKAGDTEVFTWVFPNSNNGLNNSDEFDLYSSTNLTIIVNGTTSAGLDWIYIVRTGEPTVSATIGTTGYTTFASSRPLNLSGITSSTGTTKAYYVTASDVKSSSVALTEATGNVAAGTGLILNGTAGATVTIPVVASGTDLTATNMLKGCTVATDITSATENYANFYVLGASVAEFQNIKTWIETPHTLTIPAGKAYLDTTGASVVGAPTLTFDFGETTGISASLNDKAEMINDNAIYNLNGQRVAQPTKGLYIVNGKKVVVK